MKKDKISRREFIKGSFILGSSLFISSLPATVFSNQSSLSHIRTITGFRNPYGIAVGPDGLIHVADSGNYCIKIFNGSGELITKFGKPGSSGADLNFPQGIDVDDNGDIYVMDSNNGRIAIFSRQGNLKGAIGSIGGYPGAFYTPKGICLFGKNTIYATNTRNHMIYVFDKRSQKLISNYGMLGEDPTNIEGGSLEYRFRLPTDLAVAPNGHIYVVDSKHGSIKILDKNGKFLFKFGETGSGKGQLNFPEGIALDREMNVYVCDSLNSRIQRFKDDGTLLGSIDTGFEKPTGICIDKNNTIYVVDSAKNTVNIFKWN